MKCTAFSALSVFLICLLLQSCAVSEHIDTDYLPAAVTITASVAALVLLSKKLDRSGRWRHGSEHGSAAWGNVKELDSRLCVPGLANGIISKNLRYCLEDGKKGSHGRNANAVIIGGSGAGKSRYWVIPNIMLANANYVVTDPSGELYDACAEHLKRHGYRVIRFDLEDISRSDKYNPFKYIRDDNDVIALIETLVKSTTPKDARTGDVFWTKAESALLQALMFFLYHESPECDQNFGTVLKVLRHNEVRENSDRFRSRMDKMFDELTAEDPDSIAGKQYAIYKSSAGKTAKSILIQLESRLAQFNIDSVCALTSEDELDLYSFDDGKTALFCVIPEVNEGFNWLAVILYDQIRKVLYDTAKANPGLRLRHNTRFILDEFANVALPGDFVQILSTCRKHGISMNIILQAVSQLKTLYEKEWETIIGCCDVFLYMGSNEKSTHRYISESLGKETINVMSRSSSDKSVSTSIQLSGRELMTESEVRNMPKEECIVMIAGEKPVRDLKYAAGQIKKRA